MKIFPDATALVGRTPLVQINRLFPDSQAQVLAKLEFYNPANSVKDRVGVAIVEAAEASGQLKPGGTIVEATSGNTGIALAFAGAVKGYRVIVTMPETMSKERRAIMRAFGARVVLTPGEEGMKGAVKAAEQIVADNDSAILASQFANPANPGVHRQTTGLEIWEDTDGTVDVFVAGVGTGGTISGVGQVLKAKNPKVHTVAVEPAESPLLSQGKAGSHKIQGLGANFVPKVLDREVIDEILPVTSDDAMMMARRAAAEEGLLVGISAGAALSAAGVLASRQENAGKTIVVIIPDLGERYLSSALYADLFD